MLGANRPENKKIRSWRLGARQVGARRAPEISEPWREAMLQRIGAGLVATTPVDFLLSVMSNDELPLIMRLDAAAMAAP